MRTTILVSLSILGLAACSTDQPGAQPVVVAAVETSVADLPTITVEATTTTTSTTTTTTEPRPAWVDDSEVMAFVDVAADFLDDVAAKSFEMSDAMGAADIDEAATISVDLWLMFLDAPVAPDAFPAKDEYDEWVEVSLDAMDLISDGLIYMDVPKIEKGTERLNEATALLDDYTARLDEITAEL